MGAINKALTAPVSRRIPNNVCSRLSTPVAVFSTVLRNISHINPQFSALLRTDDNKILREKIDTFIHPQYLAGFYTALRTTAPCCGTSLVFLNSTGATRPLPTAIIRFKDAYLMRVFAERSDMIMDSEASIEEVGAGLLHDINNALGGAVGYVGLTKLELSDLGMFLSSLVTSRDPEAIAEVLRDLPRATLSLANIIEGFDSIERSHEHLSSILRGFRDFCSGETKTDRHFEVPDAIRSSIAIGKGIAEAIARGKSISINISYEGPEERTCAIGNSIELQRIIINLIKNAALEFCKPNNQIKIEWTTSKSANDKKFIVIKVKDSGAPIPKPLANRLFTGKVESTHGGTGIGLLTCAQIIHGFGGEIRYQSIPDKCFVITLRAAE